MAKIKINEFPAAAGINDADLMVVGDPSTGVAKRVTVSQLKTAIVPSYESTEIETAVNLLANVAPVVGNVGSTGTVSSTDGWLKLNQIPVTPGNSYTFDAEGFTPNANKNLNFYTAGNVFISNIKVTSLPFTFSVPATTAYFTMNVKEPEISLVPTGFKLVISGSNDYIQTLADKKLAASVILDNDHNQRVIEDAIIARSSVVGSKYRNLLDKSLISVGFIGGTGTLNNSDTNYRKVRISGLSPEVVYTFSAQGTGWNPSNNKNLVFFDEANTFISRVRVNTNPFNFTTPAGTSYAYMTVAYNGDGDVLADLDNYDLMINIGDKAEAYQAYSAIMPKIFGIMGYDIPVNTGSTESGTYMTYADLKTAMAAFELAIGQRLIISEGPGGLGFIAVAISPSAIDENIDVLDGGFDFYKIDTTADKIFAYDNIACICRNSSGTWGFINDVDHAPKGVVGISAPSSSVMRITYEKTYTKIHSLVFSPDETYTVNGVSAGASVGLNVANFNFSCNGLYGEVTEVGGILTITPGVGFQSPLKTVSMNTTTGDITVTTSAISHASAMIMSRNIGHRAVLVSADSTTVVFKLIDNAGAVVKSVTGVTFQIIRTGVRTLLNSEMAVSGSNIWVQGLMMTEYSL